MSLERFLKRPQMSQAELGYKAGRSRKPLPEAASKEFQEGWVRGDSAADEAENDHQLWGRADD